MPDDQDYVQTQPSSCYSGHDRKRRYDAVVSSMNEFPSVVSPELLHGSVVRCGWKDATCNYDEHPLRPSAYLSPTS